MSDDPRLCIVGAGSLSTRRIYPYIGAAEAELVGVCDLDEAKAARNARRFGGRPWTDLDAMLAAEQPDGVIVCIGPSAHADLAIQLLERGYPVYTEKPPAPTAARTLEVARVAARTGGLCMTAFKKRYATCYRHAREWLDALPDGDLLSISVDYASAPYRNDGSERGTFLLDFAVHAIDLIGYLGGPVREVAALACGEDAWAVSLRFANGAVGSMNLNDGRSFAHPTEEVEISARGGNWLSIHNSSAWRSSRDGQPADWREPPTFTSAGDSGNETGHLAELAAFVDALRTGNRDLPSTIAESYRSMLLYETIRAAAAEGAVKTIHYEDI